MNKNIEKNTRQPYLTSLGAFALSFGCSVGWGAFVMPGTTFLPVAGPLGTALGIFLGMLAMLIIAVNYNYLINLCPDDGGTYTYTKKHFSYDHGFISAWFLILTYIAIIWANATALPLIVRTFFGGAIQFGFHYRVAGFDVYMGEIILVMASLFVGAIICFNKTLAVRIQTVMAFAILVGVAVCFAFAAFKTDITEQIKPFFSPGYNSIGGTFTIFALAPWAFVGFESISHSAGEAKYPLVNSLRIIIVSLVMAALTYIFLSVLSAAAFPEECASWTEYIANIGKYTHIKSQPAFFAANKTMGTYGSIILGTASVCAIFTGIIGNYIALSRLIHAMSEDGMLLGILGKLDKNDVPKNAIWFILVVSLCLPFFGRTAISWIVDVTTVGATIAFAFTCAASLKSARQKKKKSMIFPSIAGLFISMMFAIEFLIPNITSVKTLSTESYFILAAWGILGFAAFYYILKSDKKRRLGRSNVAWIVLLGLIIFCSSVWMRQSVSNIIDNSVTHISAEYRHELQTFGFNADSGAVKELNIRFENSLIKVENTIMLATVIQVALITIALFILFVIYSKIQKREKQIEVEKAIAEENSRAKTSFLSNMSHEIRTPMNAIIGLGNIALRDPDITKKTRECLEKIGKSAKHLLDLINDILDMSRIESGRMVIKNEEFSFNEIIEQVNIIINGQCIDKGLNYNYHIAENIGDYYFGDGTKIKQILINILGNAVKFTDSPGNVYLTAEMTSKDEEYCTLRFVIKDTGIGMDKEFIPKIFETFTQEDATTTNKYGGSGLGMAITKKFVEMMNGEIIVDSEKGIGTTFNVFIKLKPSERIYIASDVPCDEGNTTYENSVLSGRRILIAEDVDANAEILADLLELEEIVSERAADGKDAVEMFSSKPAGYYDAILMDVRMPKMDGLTATAKIRALDRDDAKVIPIIAMTANVFDEDIKNSIEAGMNIHLSKPIEPERLYEALARLIGECDN